MVAGGLDPELRHSSTAGRETEKGSAGGEMVTVSGNTTTKKRNQLFSIIITAENTKPQTTSTTSGQIFLLYLD